ncbi:MAG: hypothetical protein JXL80_04905 [Planctomycetes bacterium]|nr:hypothetical protein [Planctomycetota bacterium]
MRRHGRQILLLVVAAAVFAGTYYLETRVLEPRRLAMQGYRAALPRALMHAATYDAARAGGQSPRFIPGERRLDISDLPSRAAALSLGGLRGFFAIYLWIESEDEKNLKIHDDLLDKYYRLANLQPNIPFVWSQNSWNLTHNLSVQWSTVERRYDWVRYGIDFLAEGIRRNPKNVELQEVMGRIYFWRIANNNNAVDREYFSRKVIEDDGVDPLLMAYQWYDRARRIQDEAGVAHPMYQPSILHGQACHAMHAYAKSMTRQALKQLHTATQYELDMPPRATAETRQQHEQQVVESFEEGRKLLDKALQAWQAAREEWRAQGNRFPGDDDNAGIFGEGAERARQLLEVFAGHMTLEQLRADPHSTMVRIKSAQQYDLLVEPFMNLEPHILTVEP